MPSIIASVVQCGSVYNDTPATLAKMRRLAEQCKANDNAQLIVFPEAFVGGYPKFSTFGVTVGSRTLEGRREYVQYYKNAISLSQDGPEKAQIEAIAKDLDVFIVSGVIEKDGGTLYCTVAFFSPSEGLVYSRRKLMPTAAERLIWGFGTEKDTKVVKASFPVTSGSKADHQTAEQQEITLSSAICWENMMPLFRTHYYQQGTQIHCIPTVDGRDTWETVCKMIALEGRCFVLNACQKDFPDDHPLDGNAKDPEGIMIRGGSMIIDPLGEVLAGPLRGKEGILSAKLDLDLIVAGKFDLDVVGHYSRPDLFKLTVPQA